MLDAVVRRAFNVIPALRTVPLGDVVAAGTIAAVVWLFFTVFGQGAITESDGHSMYSVARSLGDHASFAVPQGDARLVGTDGSYYSPYGLGLPLVVLVPYLLTKPLALVVGHQDELGQFAASMVIPMIMAGIAVFLYAIARRLTASRGSSAVVALGAVFGTFLMPYGKLFFAEPLVILCFLLACERVLAGSFNVAATVFGFAVLTRPQMALACPLLVLLILHRGGWLAAMRAGSILAAAGAVLAMYNLARYGSVAEFGYGNGPDTKFDFPIDQGLHGFLLDPRKSVFLFAPIVLLIPVAVARLRRDQRDFGLFVATHALAVLLLYSAYSAWAGGWSWGPRYLLIAIIPMVPLVGPLIDRGIGYRRAAVALFAVGALVSLPTLLVPTQAQQLDRPVPSVGPGIGRQYELVPPTVSKTLGLLQGTAPATSAGAHRLYLDVWQAGLLRKNGRAGFLAGCGLTLLLLIAAWRTTSLVRRRYPRHPAAC